MESLRAVASAFASEPAVWSAEEDGDAFVAVACRAFAEDTPLVIYTTEGYEVAWLVTGVEVDGLGGTTRASSFPFHPAPPRPLRRLATDLLSPYPCRLARRRGRGLRRVAVARTRNRRLSHPAFVSAGWAFFVATWYQSKGRRA